MQRSSEVKVEDSVAEFKGDVEASHGTKPEVGTPEYMILSRMVAAGDEGLSARLMAKLERMAAEENVIFERVQEWAKYQIAHPADITDVEPTEKQQATEELQECPDYISTLPPVWEPALGEDTALDCSSVSLHPRQAYSLTILLDLMTREKAGS